MIDQGVSKLLTGSAGSIAVADLNGDRIQDLVVVNTDSADLSVLLHSPHRPTFIRGDSDGNGVVNLTDAVFILKGLFQGGPQPKCPDAADADDNGTVNLTDALYTLNYLFRGGPQPKAPFPTKGPDPTADALACAG